MPTLAHVGAITYGGPDSMGTGITRDTRIPNVATFRCAAASKQGFEKPVLGRGFRTLGWFVSASGKRKRTNPIPLIACCLLCMETMNERVDAQGLRPPTLGGNQFWVDHFVYRDWRIQKNVVTGHHRLLDANNVNQKFGSYARCRREFEVLKLERALPPLSETAVVTIHGLGRTRRSMEPIGKHLAGGGNFTWLNVTYASTRQSVVEDAQALKHIVENLEGVQKVHFVAHSLGNIVIRRYLADRKESSETDGPEIGRIVMLAPPNNGSAFARILKDQHLFKWLGGTAGQSLAEDGWEEFRQQLATPEDFGIIAGSTQDGTGSNPLLPGDDDLVVSVTETRLAGARDFYVVPSIHTLIMDKPTVQSATLRFLLHGYFHTERQRQPIVEPPERAKTRGSGQGEQNR